MKNIKLLSPWYGKEEIEAATRVLNSQVTSMGLETYEFEKELKNFWGRNDIYVLTTNSCTAAIQLALQASGIGRGDEVLVPTLTFVATFQAVLATGAIPIPCDIQYDCFLDVEDAKNRITNKTKAIIPVTYAGIDQRILEVYEFAKKTSLVVIEDAAHSFGDKNIIQRAGILCFSFDAIKNISCTDGGAIVCSDSNLAARIKDIRLLGVLGDTDKRINGQRSWDFDVVEQGWRFHMNNLCAAIGRAQLAKFDQIASRRCKYAKMYYDAFNEIKFINLLPINFNTAVPHIFPIIVKDGLRNKFQHFLLNRGINCGIQYKPNHLLSLFKKKYNLPIAEKIYTELLSIPLHPLLTEEDVLYIIENIYDFIKTI